MKVYLPHWTEKLGAAGELLAWFAAGLIGLTLLSWAVKQVGHPAGRFLRTLQCIDGHVRNLWGTALIFSLAMLTGDVGTLLVFAICSFLLLREFITITPTHRADHHTLFWIFFCILPLQYVVLGYNWYGLFTIMIPVFGFLALPIMTAAQGDTGRFLERAAKLQWAVMVCIYCTSYAPALLKLRDHNDEAAGAPLLLFLCLIVETNNTVHECVDIFGRRLITPALKTGRTLEGLVAGVAAGCALAAMMRPLTPLDRGEALVLAVWICLLASAGHLCLAAIHRERGREGVVVVHRNREMLPRVISLCFAAPVFFHLARFFLRNRQPTLF